MKITNRKLNRNRSGKKTNGSKGRVVAMTTEKVAEGKQLLDAAWKFASVVLWNRQQFTETEIAQVKMKLVLISLTAEKPENILPEFCQRILLAKKMLLAASGAALPLPSVWFDKTNRNGFEATGELMKQLNRHRQSVPAAMPEINALAMAVTAFGKEPTADKFRFWKEQLQLMKAYEMATYFQLFAASWQYDG
jgi:hypothetical protein